MNTKITSLSGTWAGTSVNTDDIGSGVAHGRGLDGGYITFLKVGYAPYVFYVPHYDGVDQEGNQLFETPSGPSNDVSLATKYYHDPNPKFNYGINNTFTYKKLSLNVFLRGVSGQKLLNNTRLIIDNIGRLPSSNVTREALTNGIKDNTPVVSDLWLQKASYLRLDNATLSYTFGKISGIDNLKVFITGTNLFVITPYKGLDPEVTNGDDVDSYIDYTYGGKAYYPKTRSLVAGVNISFK
jgi:iron complex outermembrane receptor protein